MSRNLISLLIGGLVALVLLLGSVYTVDQRQSAVVFQLGEVVNTVETPGLHFKLPLVQNVRLFDRRILTLDTPEPERYITSEKKNVLVDSYVKWRIKDAARYSQAFGVDQGAAGQRLADIVKDGIKNAVAQRTLQEIVSAERTAFTGDMFDRASKSVQSLGLELIDARVQKIGLPPDVESRVYASMQQSFSRLARQLRGEGEKEALRIRAEADRKRTEIISAAARDALKIRGDADATAAATYAGAYGRNPEFYAFYRSVQAYKNALGKEGDIMVVSPDSDFFKYMRNPNAGTR